MYIYRYYLCMYITRRAARFLLVHVLPPVWNLMAVSLIPLFYGTLLLFGLVLLLCCHPCSAIGPLTCPLYL